MDLRMAKGTQEILERFRRKRYADGYCRILSYLQSPSIRGANPPVAIKLALAGKTPSTDHGGGRYLIRI